MGVLAPVGWFGCTGRTAQVRADVPELPLDAGRGERGAGAGGARPRQWRANSPGKQQRQAALARSLPYASRVTAPPRSAGRNGRPGLGAATPQAKVIFTERHRLRPPSPRPTSRQNHHTSERTVNQFLPGSQDKPTLRIPQLMEVV